MGKYDLSSPLAIKDAADAANIAAGNEHNQGSYNAAWLHGYASALRDAAVQLEPMQRLVNEVLNYLGEHHDQSQLYDMLHEDIGMTDEEIDFLGFDLPYAAAVPAHNQSNIQAMDVDITKDSCIKQWYQRAYPTDSLGNEIRDGFTFADAFRTLENKACIYDAMGVHDSVIRERVFDELAKLHGVEYGVIYDMWCYEKIPFIEQLQSATERVSSTVSVPSPKEKPEIPEI